MQRSDINLSDPWLCYFEEILSDDVTNGLNPDSAKQLFMPAPSIGEFKIEIIETGQDTTVVESVR